MGKLRLEPSRDFTTRPISTPILSKAALLFRAQCALPPSPPIIIGFRARSRDSKNSSVRVETDLFLAILEKERMLEYIGLATK